MNKNLQTKIGDQEKGLEQITEDVCELNHNLKTKLKDLEKIKELQNKYIKHLLEEAGDDHEYPIKVHGGH